MNKSDDLLPLLDNVSIKDQRPVLFLDRDGTLIQNIPYLSDPEKVMLCRDVVLGLQLLKNYFQFVVVTNQSGIGRGKLHVSDIRKVHESLEKQFRSFKIEMNQFIYCPHKPDDCCKCRKPGSLMIEKILRLKGVDPRNCFLVGDSVTDIEAGRSAKVKSFQVANQIQSDVEDNNLTLNPSFFNICCEIAKSIKAKI